MIKFLIKIFRKSAYLNFFLEKISWFFYKKSMKKDDYIFAKKTYYKRRKEHLNLLNPITFNEKLWVLKFINKDPLMTICTDKYLVRDYVKSKGLENLLIPLIRVYSSADSIDFSEISGEVIFKCNHTSGYNAIYSSKRNFNKNLFVKRFNYVLKQNHYCLSREWNYKNINPKIICESVLRDENNNLPEDFKFLCFDGEPLYVIRSCNVINEKGTHNFSKSRVSNIYDMNYNYVPIETTYVTDQSRLSIKPDNFDDMIKIAKILSEPFPHCRVDLYNIKGRIYFGEMTFYHSGGYGNIKPIKWQYELGKSINLCSSKIKRLDGEI